MEVNVVINDQLAENAAITDKHHRDHKVDRRTLLENKKYHVFFCYRDIPNDRLWVKEVVKKLENDFGFICCDHERDFLAGTKVMSNIKFGINNSEKVVGVLSKEGLDSEYLRLEIEMAHKEGIDKRENLLIPVLLDDCEIPEELKLLTYIDARKEINETTWWPKLIAAIESKAECSFFKGRKEEETKDKSETYHCQQLCSIETTFICTQCSIQSSSKYVPKELASVVPVETIQNIKKDLLDAPIIKCQQKCSWICNGLLILFVLFCLSAFVFTIILIILCATEPIFISKQMTFVVLGCWVVIEFSIGIGLSLGFRCYYKQYIIFHLREYRKPERETFVNISETEAQHYADNIPILTRLGNEDLAQATQIRFSLVMKEDSVAKKKNLHCRHDINLETETLVDTSEMQENHIAEDVPLQDLSDNDQLDQLTEVDPNNVGLRQKDDDQGSTIVNLSDQDNRPQQFTQNSQFPHSSDLGNIENAAMTWLLMYAHEYLRLVFNGKMKNPKEDRHILDCTCLCQYIEKTDKEFRKLVDKNKIIHAKNSSIEHNTEKILDAFRL